MASKATKSKSDRPGKGTIAAFVTNLLARTSKPYAQIASDARRKFHGETSPASVRHYASRMRANGMKVKERPVTREASFA